MTIIKYQVVQDGTVKSFTDEDLWDIFGDGYNEGYQKALDEILGAIETGSTLVEVQNLISKSIRSKGDNNERI